MAPKQSRPLQLLEKPPEKKPPGLVSMYLGDAEIWREGEDLSDQELGRRVSEALRRAGDRAQGVPQRFAPPEDFEPKP